jgi:F-type H+-transporting ATPase subunit delta
MEESAITVRYARAFFLLAKEKDQLSMLKQDVELIFEVCQSSADFMRMLKNPVIRTSEKIRLMKIIFGGKISELSHKFLVLVTRNNREAFLPDISRNILSFIRHEKNIKSATLTTAQPVGPELLEKAERILEEELQTEVELTGRVNPRLIGGLILRIDDKQYDDSLATRLKKMKQEVLKVHV